MPVGTRRSDIDIIRDILAAGAGKPAELRDRVNLSYTQLQKYLTFMEQAHLIALNRGNPRGGSFHVTDKGMVVLQMLDRLLAALRPNNNTVEEPVGRQHA